MFGMFSMIGLTDAKFKIFLQNFSKLAEKGRAAQGSPELRVDRTGLHTSCPGSAGNTMSWKPRVKLVGRRGAGVNISCRGSAGKT